MNQEKRVVLEFFEQVYNRRDLDFVLESFAPDYFEHTETGARSASDAVAILRSAFHTFPNLSVEVLDIVAEGPSVAVRVQFTGTPHQPFLGVPPVRRSISWEAMEFFRVEAGVITESWGRWPLDEITAAMRDPGPVS